MSTWEDKKHLSKAKKLVTLFWADLNIKQSEFDDGEVHASEENIGESFSGLKFQTITE